MSEAFRVDLGALREAAEGVNGTLDQVAQEKVTDIPHDPPAAGHERLAGTLSDFLGRWERGVDNLAKDGREIAARLTANVNAYQKADQNAHDELHGIYQGNGPDPGVR